MPSRIHILRRISLNSCPYCFSSGVYLSKPGRWWEKMLFVFLLQLMRCHNCMRHHYRPIILVSGPPTNQDDLLRPPHPGRKDKKKQRCA